MAAPKSKRDGDDDVQKRATRRRTRKNAKAADRKSPEHSPDRVTKRNGVLGRGKNGQNRIPRATRATRRTTRLTEDDDQLAPEKAFLSC
jgi:hypothetical protein